jgi:hypothetical protein
VSVAEALLKTPQYNSHTKGLRRISNEPGTSSCRDDDDYNQGVRLRSRHSEGNRVGFQLLASSCPRVAAASLKARRNGRRKGRVSVITDIANLTSTKRLQGCPRGLRSRGAHEGAGRRFESLTEACGEMVCLYKRRTSAIEATTTPMISWPVAVTSTKPRSK